MCRCLVNKFVFSFKQKTAYELLISDWSSDVCSSDLVFAQAGTEYALKHGVTAEQFAKVAVKNHLHSTLNPLAQYQKEFSLDEVMGAEVISYPNTLPMCCPTGDGAAAVVLVSDAKLRTLDPDVRRRAGKVSSSVMTADPATEGGQVTPDARHHTRQGAHP